MQESLALDPILPMYLLGVQTIRGFPDTNRTHHEPELLHSACTAFLTSSGLYQTIAVTVLSCSSPCARQVCHAACACQQHLVASQSLSAPTSCNRYGLPAPGSSISLLRNKHETSRQLQQTVETQKMTYMVLIMVPHEMPFL